MDGEWDEEYCQECQENEKAALKAIYGDEVIAVSGSNENKKPLECKFFLGPLASSRRRTMNDPSVELHVICSKSYPYNVPEIKIVKWKKVSNNSIIVLSDQLQSLAKKLKGEVMIFQLASHVESFLLESIQHGFESFYDEMITRNKEKEEKEMNERKKREKEKREEILQQIQSKQQAVKKALKKKNEARKSVCEEETRDLTKEEKILISAEEKDTSNLECPIQPMNQLDSEELTQLYMSARPGQTRFENEFQHIKWIGKGAFGDVLKVRNRLDDGYYAIKRIQLNASNKQLNKKIVREVKLLSRLNHENVVRYYNSWIEHGTCLPLHDDEDEEDEGEGDEDDESDKKLEKDLKPTVGILPRIHDISPEWSEKEEGSSRESSESDWVDFRSSSHSRNDKSTGEPDSNETKESSKNVFYYLYIQMELCEKSTLRIAIDSDLFEERDRVWRLLREIIEGLCHIHQQGIIHRDLKPVNIFIGNDDHVKIGDFGLATSSVLQKSGLSRDLTLPSDQGDKSGSFLTVSTSQKDNLLTGKVGTMYYVAPELSDYNPRLNYNQKVDIYSLGIIFFEMCHPPFQTSMERFKVLSDVRLANPVFPTAFQYSENSDEVKLLRWMLNHDVKERPNSLELLQSDFLPPPKLEEGEVKEMVRRTLTNPQSKDYKFLVASCFQQVMQPALDATFNISSWRSLNFNYGLEFVCQKIKTVFRQHGAVSFMPPLFTPAHQPVSESAVCLMTRLGGIVYATHDLRAPFARYLIQNPHITHLKRYAIDKVYREKPAGIHPKEIYECSFDIVTPSNGNLMPELEILSVIWEVLNEFPSILQRNCVLYLNHSVIVQSLLSISGIDESKQKSLGKLIYKAKEKSQNKTELSNHLKSLSLSDFSISNVLSWIDKEGNSNKMEAEVEELIDDPSTLNKCKAIFQQIDKIIQQCEILGFTSPVLVKLGLMTNAHNYSGLIIQIVCDQRSRNKYMENNIILSGGRYDKLLSDLREVSPFGERKFNQSVCGFTLYLDKLITLLSSQEKISVIDVLICTLGTIQITLDRIKLLKDLWRSGIKSYFINTMETLDDIHDFCQDQHIPVIVLLKECEPTYARVKTRVKDKSVSTSKDRFIEKKVPCNDLVDYLAKIVNKNHESLTPLKIENSRASISEAININLLPVEKINPSAKRRFESQISNAVSSVVQRFSSKVKVDVIAVSLETEALKLYSNCLDLATGEHDMNTFIKKFPRHKKYAYKIMELVEDLRKQHHSLVVILYSLLDNNFKVNM